jgi:hypothetical protein
MEENPRLGARRLRIITMGTHVTSSSSKAGFLVVAQRVGCLDLRYRRTSSMVVCALTLFQPSSQRAHPSSTALRNRRGRAPQDERTQILVQHEQFIDGQPALIAKLPALFTARPS